MRLVLAAALFALLGCASAPEAPASAVYADEANWLCRPGRDDACAVDLTSTVVEASGAMRSEPFQRAADASVDCFYVYPTVSNDPGVNSDLVANDEELRVIASQFARFGAVCRTYAPIYRQVTLTALRTALTTGQPLDPAAGALAYADVAAAFRHYIEHDNNGRPFVLVGHSQGARMLQLLVEREIDGSPVQERMLSAMLLGINTHVPDDGREVGGDFRTVPLCRSAQQTGCIVTYVSFRADDPPPANSRFGRSSKTGEHVACTNPAALAGGEETPLDAYLGARGAGQSSLAQGPWVSNGPDVQTAFVNAPGLLSGRCVRDEHGSYLAITVRADPNDPRTDTIVGDVTANGRVLPEWGLHLMDVSLAQGDLIGLVRSQSAAYAARRQ